MTCPLLYRLLFFILIFPLCDQLSAQENAALVESMEELIEAHELDEQLIESLADILMDNDTVAGIQGKQKTKITIISTSWGTLENDGTGFLAGDSANPLSPGLRLRCSAKASGYTIKAIAENDPGEVYQNNPDHMSAGIAIHPRGEPFRIFFGDYHVRHGLGLGFRTRPVFSSWKSEPNSVLKSSSGLSLHGSSDESSFLRGGALELNLGSFTARSFISALQLDAGIWDDGNGVEYFSSINKTGYHRTENEVERKDALREEISGAQFQFSGGRFEAGGIFTHFNYSCKYRIPQGHTWPGRDASYESIASRYSFFGRMIMGEGMVQAEYAGSSTGGSAMILGYSGFFNKGFSYLLAFEISQSGFFSHHTVVSSALIDRSDTKTGRINIMYRPRKWLGIQMDICLDGVSDPVSDGVSAGYRFRSRIMVEPEMLKAEVIVRSLNGNITTSLKIKEADSEKSLFWQGEIGISTSGLKNIIKGTGSYLSLRCRYRSASQKLDLKAGIASFSKRNGSPVFYSYEPDLLYGMSIPALSGSGTRAFFAARYRVSEGLMVEGKVWRAERFESGVCKIGWKVQAVYQY